MTKPRPYSTDELAFLAIWRRLARGESIPPVTFSTKAQAQSVKMKAYSVLKPYRHGVLDDPELKDAAERFGIQQNGAMLTFGPKVTTLAAHQLIEQLGLTESELQQPEEMAVRREIEANKLDLNKMLAKYSGGSNG